MIGFDPKRGGGAGVLSAGGVRYELVRRIGAGALGEVHEARAATAGFERRVCVKRVGAGGGPEAAQGLLAEGGLLGRIRHANVVSLLAVGAEPADRPFLVLELVDGLDLHALREALRRRRRRLPDAVAVHVICALLRALGAAQRALPGLVHRDVTPHNVLVSRDGEVKLADFGIALWPGDAPGREAVARPTPVRGTLGYMSPEQVEGSELDGRSDLFSVGVVAFELLAGERPWGRRRGIRELRAALEEASVPLSRRRPDLAPALAASVDRLVARRRDGRFARPEDALRALAPFGAGEMGAVRLASAARRALASQA